MDRRGYRPPQDDGLWQKIKRVATGKPARIALIGGALAGGAEIAAEKLAEKNLPPIETAHIDTTPVEGGEYDATKKLPPQLRKNLFLTEQETQTPEVDSETPDETDDDTDPEDDVETTRQQLINFVTDEFKNAYPNEVITYQELLAQEKEIDEYNLPDEEKDRYRQGLYEKIHIAPDSRGNLTVTFPDSQRPVKLIPHPEDWTITISTGMSGKAEHVEPSRVPSAAKELMRKGNEEFEKREGWYKSAKERMDEDQLRSYGEELTGEMQKELGQRAGEITKENKPTE